MLQYLQKLFKKDQLCSYGCGQKAHYLVAGESKPCCVSRAYDCPGYKKWCGDRQKQRYKDRPEMIETQRRVGKEVHNREEVKNKKSIAMLNLHKSDEKFVKNYEIGRDSYRILVKGLAERGEHWAGSGESYSYYHSLARQKYYKPYCEKCGCTFMLHQHLYAMDLHIHNIDEDYTNLSEDNWITLCAVCHGKEHRKEREE